MADDGEQVSWREVAAHAPVLTRDGAEAGKVVEVAALDQEDIFHGVVLSHGRRHVLAPAADIARITRAAVHLSVDGAAVDAYEPFQELHVKRLGLRGVFNWKHLGWKDSSE